MYDLVGRSIADRINQTHDSILTLCDALSNDEICLRAAKTAPPIGWHLWHIARWADHFQASFPDSVQIWKRDDYPVQWVVDTTFLGPMETGMGMPVFLAAETIQKIGKVRLVDYARLVFTACRDAMRGLNMEHLAGKRQSFMTFKREGDTIVYAQGADTTLLEDAIWHISHANRHRGMIEALIGATLERKKPLN